jgi:hypothetical protein
MEEYETKMKNDFMKANKKGESGNPMFVKRQKRSEEASQDNSVISLYDVEKFE